MFCFVRRHSHRVRHLRRRRVRPLPTVVGQNLQDHKAEGDDQNPQRVPEHGLGWQVGVRPGSVGALPVDGHAFTNGSFIGGGVNRCGGGARHSQREEELLVDAGDAGDDAERQDDAAEPHVDGFDQLAQRHGRVGQQEDGRARRPLGRDVHRFNRKLSQTSQDGGNQRGEEAGVFTWKAKRAAAAIPTQLCSE